MSPLELRRPVQHDLKSWPADFEAVRVGAKTAEIRRCDDRQFRVNDVLALHEFDPMANEGKGEYSGRLIRVRCTQVDRMAGPRVLCAIGTVGADDVIPFAVLSFGKIS